MKKLAYWGFIVISFFSVSSLKAQDKQQVINKVWKAVGGKSTFEKTRYMQFTFAVEREGKTLASRDHLWDRYTGDYRFETTDQDGKKTVVLFNINTKKGTVYQDGTALKGEANDKMVQKAYATFINDSYWLMVPLKLQDPGVNTELMPSEEVNGTKCDIIHLNFDKVGLTPGDQYWLYVNDDTGEIIQWKFLLQGQKNSSIFVWSPYQDLGNGLKLSTKKTNEESKSSIYFPTAKVLASVEQDIFIKP